MNTRISSRSGRVWVGSRSFALLLMKSIHFFVLVGVLIYTSSLPFPAEAQTYYDEPQVRYVMADIQLGGGAILQYYRDYLDQPNIAEAIQRWENGVRVVNIGDFERKVVGSWLVAYTGTNNRIDGWDVILTTDPPLPQWSSDFELVPASFHPNPAFQYGSWPIWVSVKNLGEQTIILTLNTTATIGPLIEYLAEPESLSPGEQKILMFVNSSWGSVSANTYLPIIKLRGFLADGSPYRQTLNIYPVTVVDTSIMNYVCGLSPSSFGNWSFGPEGGVMQFVFSGGGNHVSRANHEFLTGIRVGGWSIGPGDWGGIHYERLPQEAIQMINDTNVSQEHNLMYNSPGYFVGYWRIKPFPGMLYNQWYLFIVSSECAEGSGFIRFLPPPDQDAQPQVLNVSAYPDLIYPGEQAKVIVSVKNLSQNYYISVKDLTLEILDEHANNVTKNFSISGMANPPTYIGIDQPVDFDFTVIDLGGQTNHFSIGATVQTFVSWGLGPNLCGFQPSLSQGFSYDCQNPGSISTYYASTDSFLQSPPATASLTIHPYDEIPPTTQYFVEGTSGNNGWYKSNVVIALSAVDNVGGSGILKTEYSLDNGGTWLEYLMPFSLTNEGVTTLLYRSIDKANNLEGNKTLEIKVDKTPPILNSIIFPNPIYLHGSALTSSGAQDALSGLASESCSQVDTNTVGFKTLICTATDLAGNFATTYASYHVIYRFDGFLQPINDTAHTQICGDPCPASIFKGGSIIPIKFLLKDINGSIVQASSSLFWIAPQRGGVTNAAIDENIFLDVPTSGISYLWDGQQYHYNWKTKNIATGYYWRIGVALDDGQTYYVYIGLQ